jgi:desulfoferrodoxin (superoxide reductase-like protein)
MLLEINSMSDAKKEKHTPVICCIGEIPFITVFIQFSRLLSPSSF